MKVYLAAPYSARDVVATFAVDLASAGIACTARWLTGSHEITDGSVGSATAYPDTEVATWALEDLQDIDQADVLVAFTAASVGVDAGRGGSGGRHIETGYAIGQRKPVLVVGDPENVFHRLPSACTVLPTWLDALLELAEMDSRLRQGSAL